MRRGLAAPGLRGFLQKLGAAVKEGVATGAGFLEVAGAEGSADAFLGDRRGMHDVVNEPGAVIVPEMVIRVLWIGANA